MKQNVTAENLYFKFAKQSSHYFLGHVLQMLGGFISFPILTRVFSKSNYGALSLVSITIFTLLPFAKLGMQEAAVRFYHEFKMGIRKDRLPVFYSTLYFGSLSIVLVVVLLVFILYKTILMNIIPREMQDLVWLVLLMVISGSMILRLTNFYRAEQQTKLYNAVLVVHRFLGLGLALAFIFLVDRTLRSYLVGLLIAEFLIVIFLSGFLFWQQKIELKSFSWFFLRECILFGIPFIGLELSDYLIKSIDRYLIQIFLGLDAVGLYSAASNLCIYIKDGVFYPLIYAITPIYMELWTKRGAKATGEFLSKVLNYLLMISIPIIVGFSILGKQVIIIAASSEFEEAAQVIPYIITGALLWGFSPIFSAGLYAQKKTKHIMFIVFIGVILNILLNLVLIPTLQLRGSALAILLTYAVLLLLLQRVSSKYLSIKIDVGACLKYCIAAGLMGLLLHFVNLGSTILDLFLEIAIAAAFYVGMIMLFDAKIRKNALSFSQLLYAKKVN